jgi:hypothetical protein
MEVVSRCGPDGHGFSPYQIDFDNAALSCTTIHRTEFMIGPDRYGAQVVTGSQCPPRTQGSRLGRHQLSLS